MENLTQSGETGTHNGKSNTYAVICGGCFNYPGSNSPIMYRSGKNKIDDNWISIGFRVVLYVK